jgi:transposase
LIFPGLLGNAGTKEAAMFLRRYRRTKDGKTHTYFALVESVRTSAGPRQRVVAHLGELSASEERRWQHTVVFHNRLDDVEQLQLFPNDDPADRTADLADHTDDRAVVRIRLDSVGWSNPRRFGDVWLARWLWQMLDLEQIVDRHLPQGDEDVRPADMVAIEVINRLCQPCSEFALAEHWYASTALEELLGVPDALVTKDRLYRTLDRLRTGQVAIENDLKAQLGTLFQLDYDLLLYDITSSYFEGLAEDNDLAERGHSRDHRQDCKQIVIALVVTREGFPLAHETFAGNTRDLTTVKHIITTIEKRFGKSQRVWVMDRGMIDKDVLAFLNQEGRRYLFSTSRHDLKNFAWELSSPGWQHLPENPEVQVKLLQRDGTYYLLARSKPRRHKERAIRRRQRRGLAMALKKLLIRVQKGRLKKRDKILEAVGRLKARYPKAHRFVTTRVGSEGQFSYVWKVDVFKTALVRDGAYLLRSNQMGWTAQEFWETYIQLTVIEHAFRVLKSNLLLRPIWHHYSGRTQAHVFVCVLAYALWKTLDHLAKRAGLMTVIRKADDEPDEAVTRPRPMTPEVILRELSQIQLGDIHLETTDHRQLLLRRVSRPQGEAKRILAALGLEVPERLSADRVL